MGNLYHVDGWRDKNWNDMIYNVTVDVIYKVTDDKNKTSNNSNKLYLSVKSTYTLTTTIYSNNNNYILKAIRTIWKIPFLFYSDFYYLRN